MQLRRASIGKDSSDYSNRRDTTDEIRFGSRLSKIKPVGSTSTLREDSINKSRSSSIMKDDIAPAVFKAKMENRLLKTTQRFE